MPNSKRSPSQFNSLTYVACGIATLLMAIVYLAIHFGESPFNRPLGIIQFIVFFWGTVGLLVSWGILQLLKRDFVANAEIGRWIVIGIATLYLLGGMTRASLHGGGDARWYATMLADMVAQTRAGVFPVWVGQSEYQFNGAVYTLRVAPAFLYYGALLDVLTFHSLEIFQLQNLLLVLLGVAAAYTAYFCLAELLIGNRSLAAGLTLLFIGCPGVLAVVYNADLYMSWTTLPLIPVILYSNVRSFNDDDLGSVMILLGTSLGLCWWCHPPIALWMTLISTVMQSVGIIIRNPAELDWSSTILGAIAFICVSAYPLGSVLLFPADPVAGGISFQSATSAELIIDQVKSVFPDNFLPLSDNGGKLSDFQLGYALISLLLFSTLFLSLKRWETRTLLGLGYVLIFLVAIPIPHIALLMWNIVPAIVRKITARWVMNRLYIPLSAIIVFGLASAARSLSQIKYLRLLCALTVLGCGWSLFEARKFLRISPPAPRDAELKLENAMLTRYAYFGFSHLPDYFTDGVDLPMLENRLLFDPTGQVLTSNLDSALKNASKSASLDLFPMGDDRGTDIIHLKLKSGKHYIVNFKFINADAAGILQLSGDSLFREYALPSYGERLSFGIGDQHSHLLPVWTSSKAGEEILMRFVPSSKNSGNNEGFAHVTLYEFDPSRLPIRVLSWIPYEAIVRSPTESWLETPRMFQRGYAATVNRKCEQVAKSSHGLVSIRIPAGASRVTLRYSPPWELSCMFWISFAAIPAFGGIVIFRLIFVPPSFTGGI